MAHAPTASALSISVDGSRFVNGEGKTVRLLGVDRSSTEYACYDGYAYANGENLAEPLDEAEVGEMASWTIDAVRIPLNEDCWLGINGEPGGTLTTAGYRAAIATYVRDLNAHGIYAILDLHWTAPGSQGADGQRSMPDGHSLEFWEDVATEFTEAHAVLFDVLTSRTAAKRSP